MACSCPPHPTSKRCSPTGPAESQTPNAKTGCASACAFVDAARSEGMLPEHVVIAVRDAVKRSGARLADRTTQRVTQWCMQRYFQREA
jgi:hypothetical protein